MPGTITIGGQKIPKWGLYAGGAAAAGILLYAYWSRSGSSSGSNDEAPAESYDDTGYGEYGESGYSGIGIYDPATGGTIGTGYGQTVTTANNAAWTQAAILYLGGTYDQGALSTAIGKALNGRPMTDTEINMFNAARAALGDPPQGFPPIRHVGSSTPAGTSGSKLKPVTGTRATATTTSTITLTWNRLSGAKGYRIYAVPDKAGGAFPRGIAQGTSVFSSFTLRGLKPNTSYRVDVHGIGSDDKQGPAPASRFYVKTKATKKK